MGESYGGGRMLGTALLGTGVVLAALGVAWMVTNAATGLLEPGGFVLGLFFLSLFVVPMVLVGLFLRRRGAAEEGEAAAFEERRRLFERDRIFRQLLQRETSAAARQVGDALSRVEGESSEPLRQAQRALEGLARMAAEPVRESAWLEAAPLAPGGERDVARYDDLLLAGIRRIRDVADVDEPPDSVTAKELLGLARSAERQFALRQDLLLRGRSLPSSSPLRLLKGDIPERGRIAPESLGPGAGVSMGPDDYLVTARATYFAEGREWYALSLRGQEGERRLQVEPGAESVLFMEPVEVGRLPGKVEENGTASVAVSGLASAVDGVVVDYRRIRTEDGLTGWWERWPEGERAYSGRWVKLAELQLWPSAVAGE